MEIDFSALSDLTEKLEQLGLAVANVGARRAVRAGAKVIRDAMQQRAPVLDRRTPGSTALMPGELKAGMRVYVPQNADPVEAFAGPSSKVEHVARWVEYGHRQVRGGHSKVLASGRSRGPGTASSVDVPAHPFLRPAYEESMEPALMAIKASIAATIEEGVK